MLIHRAAFEAVPNFSEGRDRQLVAALGAGPDVLGVHADPDHNRCVVTIAHAELDRVAGAAFDRVALAVERIDLRRHGGLHPRVGAADVVPLVPLGDAAMADAVAAAHALADRIWSELRVPVYLYGEAAGGRRLADIRAGRARPDLGAPGHPTAGSACVGARPPLVAYNLAFDGLDLRDVGEIARRMRRMPGVQALAFRLPGGRVQLSMNLTRLEAAGVPAVHDLAAELAGRPGEPELVGLCPAAAAGPGCAGGILEARLAGAAAAAAARAAAGRPGEEMARMAERLAAEARSLPGLTADQDDLLAGAERAAALVRVLAAGGLSTPGLEAMIGVAAVGLRAALRPETIAARARRTALLDGWLGGDG